MANYIVLEMDLNDKWWDKWFVVGRLSIDRSIKLHHNNYFSMSSVYLLARGDIAKKEFFVRKPRRNLKGFWSKMDMIGVIDDLTGLLSEVCKFCGDDIFCVTDPRVPEEDLAKGQNIFVYFALGTPEKSERMEKFLKENNFLFLMADDVPFTD